MRLFVLGYPGAVGGANTELWHTLKLWRWRGFAVTLIPTWRTEPKWQERLQAIGCRTVETDADHLSTVPGLPGSIVVSMCNSRFLAIAERVRDLGCKIVWAGCMNWLFPAERLHYRKCGVFDRHVFQSRYQQEALTSQLKHYGFREEQGRLIRGAFDPTELVFQPRPHCRGEAFVIGRLSRAAVEKFSPRTWEIYSRIPHAVRVRILGWNHLVASRIGAPPPVAECLPPGAEPVPEFLGSLHALVQANSQAVENWPRVGLEAMAAGVPLVVENRGGWREMIRHGQTGLLCDTPEEMAYHAARLAYDEPQRQQIVHQARQSLENELAPAEELGRGWERLFQELETGQSF
jgi:glycosyltransferase involved in cell wall biosynthesis